MQVQVCTHAHLRECVCVNRSCVGWCSLTVHW